VADQSSQLGDEVPELLDQWLGAVGPHLTRAGGASARSHPLIRRWLQGPLRSDAPANTYDICSKGAESRQTRLFEQCARPSQESAKYPHSHYPRREGPDAYGSTCTCKALGPRILHGGQGTEFHPFDVPKGRRLPKVLVQHQLVHLPPSVRDAHARTAAPQSLHRLRGGFFLCWSRTSTNRDAAHKWEKRSCAEQQNEVPARDHHHRLLNRHLVRGSSRAQQVVRNRSPGRTK